MRVCPHAKSDLVGCSPIFFYVRYLGTTRIKKQNPWQSHIAQPTKPPEQAAILTLGVGIPSPRACEPTATRRSARRVCPVDAPRSRGLVDAPQLKHPSSSRLRDASRLTITNSELRILTTDVAPRRWTGLERVWCGISSGLWCHATTKPVECHSTNGAPPNRCILFCPPCQLRRNHVMHPPLPIGDLIVKL